jgi:uroporphyrinogen decarboxylase
MATYRETVKRAIEFGGPDWTPYMISFRAQDTAECWGADAVPRLQAALRDLGVPERNGVFAEQPIVASVYPAQSTIGADAVRTGTPREPFRPLSEGEWADEWGVIWTDRHMPRAVGHPFESGWEEMAGYQLPDPRAPGRYDGAKKVIADHPDRYALGHVWFTLFERLWFLRGFNNMLMDPYVYPNEFTELRDRILAFSVASIEEQLKLGVDGIYFSDDWGTQLGLLMKPDDWRAWFKPCYQAMFDAVHAGGAHVWMHLCGNVTAIIGDLIEIGLNVLNPLQPQAMDVAALAAEFGGRVCFHGGADVQGTLPRGSVQDVEDEVKYLIDTLGNGSGGYFGGTSHSIMPETPTENIVALFRAFREHSGWAGDN